MPFPSLTPPARLHVLSPLTLDLEAGAKFLAPLALVIAFLRWSFGPRLSRSIREYLADDLARIGDNTRRIGALEGRTKAAEARLEDHDSLIRAIPGVLAAAAERTNAKLDAISEDVGQVKVDVARIQGRLEREGL